MVGFLGADSSTNDLNWDIWLEKNWGQKYMKFVLKYMHDLIDESSIHVWNKTRHWVLSTKPWWFCINENMELRNTACSFSWWANGHTACFQHLSVFSLPNKEIVIMWIYDRIQLKKMLCDYQYLSIYYL